ncbi:hypothetical protein [Marispirochaeta aestuarii]|uniref:hypothetical protein n=1 Tax=Marispirochaeta aestuarii TaxID=1963862 RepID=UPI0029C70013|nr:hypothetical protein [Marispirochaeta aestuarii]
MTSLKEFRALLFSQSLDLRPESVPLSEAAGRFPMEPLASPIDLPPVEGLVKKGRYLKAGVDFVPCDRLGAAEIAGLAAAGISRVMVWRMVNAGFLAVGGEGVRLKVPGERREPEEQYSPLGHMFSVLLDGAGAWPVDYGILPEEISLRRAMEKGLEECPVFIVAGADPAEVRDFLAAPGRELLCDGVEIEGGEGLLFGRITSDQGVSAGFLFSFPSGAVPAFLCFHLFVRPFLYGLNGGGDPAVMLRCTLTEAPGGGADTCSRLVPVRLGSGPDGLLAAEPLNIEGPDHVTGLIGAHGCALFNSGCRGSKAGSPVDVLLFP